MSRRSHDTWGPVPVALPPAPRINPRPLPDIKSPLMVPPFPMALPPPLTAPRPSTSHRHRRQESADELGYTSALEPSAARRPRPPPQVVRTPLAPAPPLKGILKTGGSESSVIFRASLIQQQDRDGYASSPEKVTSLRPSQAPPGGSSKLKSKPPQIASTASADPRKPPATLHWKLLPFDAQRSKGQLKFDCAREVDEIILAEGQRGPRPLTTLERNKSAAEPGLTEMVIYCMELPDWPVYVVRQLGIRCVDVFDAIRDTYNVVLTTTERSNHQARVRDIERRRPPTPEGVKKGLRRRDLLEGKTLFLGLDWRTSDSRYPNGCWCLKVGSPSP